MVCVKVITLHVNWLITHSLHNRGKTVRINRLKSVRMLNKSIDIFMRKNDTIKEIIEVFNEILRRELSWMFSFL